LPPPCLLLASPPRLRAPAAFPTIPLDTPPFFGYALRPGVTFTYLGLRTDETAAVRFRGRPSPNLFVAGGQLAGVRTGSIFIENGQTVTTSYAIPATINAMSTGPITIDDDVTVTIPDGSRWVVL
jgi:hypothetical protein